MSELTSHCCLCGLMCPLQQIASPQGDPRRTICSYRNVWLAVENHNPHSLSQPANAVVKRLAHSCRSTDRCLIWLDSADVNTVRAAVDLAITLRATVHVGRSTGVELVSRVMKTDGWLGTSLAEVANQADLIITLGDGVLTEAPLLAERFILASSANSRLSETRPGWCHITEYQESSVSAQTSRAELRLAWPGAVRYEKLTNLLLHLRNDAAAPELLANERKLLDRLRESQYVVWLWDADSFYNELDELCVRRMLGISRRLSEAARCGLLCLDNNVGRVTAEETLLWLTGCGNTAAYDGRNWSNSPEHAWFTLDDWQQAFDTILLVRSTPSLRPLPNINASHYLLPSTQPIDKAIEWQRVALIAATGEGSSGHLMRGDRAMTLLSAPTNSLESPRMWPSASEILTTTATLLRTESERK